MEIVDDVMEDLDALGHLAGILSLWREVVSEEKHSDIRTRGVVDVSHEVQMTD